MRRRRRRRRARESGNRRGETSHISLPPPPPHPPHPPITTDRLRKHWEGKDSKTTRTPSGGKNLFLAFTSTVSFTQTKGTEAGSEGKWMMEQKNQKEQKNGRKERKKWGKNKEATGSSWSTKQKFIKKEKKKKNPAAAAPESQMKKLR